MNLGDYVGILLSRRTSKCAKITSRKLFYALLMDITLPNAICNC